MILPIKLAAVPACLPPRIKLRIRVKESSCPLWLAVRMRGVVRIEVCGSQGGR